MIEITCSSGFTYALCVTLTGWHRKFGEFTKREVYFGRSTPDAVNDLKRSLGIELLYEQPEGCVLVELGDATQPMNLPFIESVPMVYSPAILEAVYVEQALIQQARSECLKQEMDAYYDAMPDGIPF
ncbi:hypothetical protein Dxin01_00207 [Deinococcus xinjiangensis]|uniref:Uncharacterized protein n=1 Tax=Deinococcus xinjiangensis TaxID=457454 RepID=A0ABP9V706_9DEIO